MRSCAIGGVIGVIPLAALFAIGACRSTPPRADVPPVTAAPPNPNVPILNEHAGPATPIEGGAPVATPPSTAPVTSELAWTARFVDVSSRVDAVDAKACAHPVLLAVVRGTLSALGETLQQGDFLFASNVDRIDAKGQALAVVVSAAKDEGTCGKGDAGAPSVHVVRAGKMTHYEWAKGTMRAHGYRIVDSASDAAPSTYLGRLEGTAAVPEHSHPGSWELLAFADAAGTLTVDGKEQRIAPKQVVAIPPGAKHAWKPDQGAKLVAIQVYSPAGPEERFAALAAAEKDAGAPPDAGKR